MPRPCKRRRVCAMPCCGRFTPVSGGIGESIRMTVDEFESIRLIDLLDLTQEACAQQMGVSRTTAQAIYNCARKKLAVCLVEGRELEIEGGDYVLCSGGLENCPGCGGNCRKKKGRDGDGTDA